MRALKSAGNGIGKRFKESAFGGEIGKLSNKTRITDEWENIGTDKIKEEEGLKK